MFVIYEVFKSDGKRFPVYTSDEMIDCEVYMRNYTTRAIENGDAKLVIEEEGKGMKLFVAIRESGDLLEEVNSYEEGLDLIEQWEEEDRENGLYSPNFYEIEDEECYRMTKVRGEVMRASDVC